MKTTLSDVTSGQNVSTINTNFQKIETILNEEVLFRKDYPGEPNSMNSNLDMNGNRIYNLPAPINNNEPVRLIDLQGLTGGGGGGGGGGTGLTNGIFITASPYNADKTGVTDIKAACESAFLDCPDGGMIVFPAGGTYKLSSWNVSGKNLTIYAEGAKINVTSALGGILKTDHNTRLRIIGGEWTGATTAVPLKYATATPPGGTAQLMLIVEGSKFTSTNAFCVHLELIRESVFSNCEFSTTSGTTLANSGGVYMKEANNPYFSQCIFKGQQKGYGFWMDGQGSPRSANPILSSCEVLGWNHNVRIEGCDDFHLIGCTIDYGVSSNTVISSVDQGKIIGGYLGGGIDATSSWPALHITSSGATGWDLELTRQITVTGVSFTNHQFTGTNMDIVKIDGPDASRYPVHVTITGCNFLGYTSSAIKYSTISQLTITDNTFVQYGTLTEPTTTAIKNATGTGDSLVIITGNQFPNGSTGAGSGIQSANVTNNPGLFANANGGNTLLSQLNGFTGFGGFGTSYFHFVNAKGPLQFDRYAGTPTMRFRRSSGTYPTPTASGTADAVLNLIGDAHDGTSWRNVASFQAYTDGTQTTTSAPGRLMLATTPVNGVTMVPRMEIDAAGNVFFNSTAVANSGGLYFGGATTGAATLGILYGSGSPEASVTAKPGSIFASSSGEVYKKVSGTGNTGWSAMGSGGATVFLHATSNVAQTMTAGAETTLSFGTEIADTAAAWDGSTFTVPSTGYYTINARMFSQQHVWPIDTRAELRIFVNGTIARRGSSAPAQTNYTGLQCSFINADLSLTAGDLVTIRAFNSNGSNTLTNGSANDNYLTIKKT